MLRHLSMTALIRLMITLLTQYLHCSLLLHNSLTRGRFQRLHALSILQCLDKSTVSTH